MPWTAKVFEVQPQESPPVRFQDADYPTCSTLESWVSKFGGYVGELQDPRDPTIMHRISLETWNGRDPARTWIKIVFVETREPPTI